MRVIASLLIAAVLCIQAESSRAQAPIDPATLPPWQVPDPATLPNDDYGRAVRYGRDLIRHTSALIGPDATNPAMRFAGNGLECQSCHLDAGTTRFALPLVGIWNLYPAFSARVGALQSMADRINDCMARSMNGRPLPLDGPEINAIQAYIRFLGSDQPGNTPLVGRRAPALPLPDRAADPVHGAEVYQRVCAVCHRSDGAGVRYDLLDAERKQQRYLFPPLWGPDSYNDGAGMSRNITAAWFVHANMPRGITFAYPQIGTTDAYDVVSYINEQPRPHESGLGRDYPDPWLKPADAAFPPLVGPFPPSQHELGPWPPIEFWLKYNMPDNRQGPRASGDLEAAIGTPALPAR